MSAEQVGQKRASIPVKEEHQESSRGDAELI
jgi:hypothetical protein